MKITAFLLAALPAASSAFTLSIANGLPIRRSVAKFTDDKVPEDSVAKAAEAALMAPNHFLSEPTRMYDLGSEAVEKLKGLNEDKAKMFAGVPGWMVFSVKTEHLDENGGISAKLALEDHATVACAAQNFMQSLAEDGVGSKWMTGALGIDPAEIMKVAGAPEDEKMIGVIWYGMPAKPIADMPAPKRKLSVDDVLTKVA
jgi:nitroreductase